MKVGAAGAIGPVCKNNPVVGLKFGVVVDTQYFIGSYTCSSRKDSDNTLGFVTSGVASRAVLMARGEGGGEQESWQ